MGDRLPLALGSLLLPKKGNGSLTRNEAGQHASAKNSRSARAGIPTAARRTRFCAASAAWNARRLGDDSLCLELAALGVREAEPCEDLARIGTKGRCMTRRRRGGLPEVHR